MATIVTLPTLATFARVEIDPADEFALLVLEEASGLVCDTAGHPEWEDDPTKAPRSARRICLQVAYRTFTNPDFEIAYGMGPLSGRNLDLYAMGLNLSELEMETLEDLQPKGGNGGLWIQPISDDDLQRPQEIYFHDVRYPSTDPFPYLGPGDVFYGTPEVS